MIHLFIHASILPQWSVRNKSLKIAPVYALLLDIEYAVKSSSLSHLRYRKCRQVRFRDESTYDPQKDGKKIDANPDPRARDARYLDTTVFDGLLDKSDEGLQDNDGRGELSDDGGAQPGATSETSKAAGDWNVRYCVARKLNRGDSSWRNAGWCCWNSNITEDI